MNLTHEQIDLLNQTGGAPLRLVNPDTNQEYVLLSAEMYEQLRGTLADIDPRETYPALHRALHSEGWDDPQMDEYNRYA
ncbi:MAG TPA: hypothetical protein VMP01_00505 [Pirellulaceae bacterium]|nr:hypothetical protein [Pirellulaceae bacterium]